MDAQDTKTGSVSFAGESHRVQPGELPCSLRVDAGELPGDTAVQQNDVARRLDNKLSLIIDEVLLTTRPNSRFYALSQYCLPKAACSGVGSQDNNLPGPTIQ